MRELVRELLRELVRELAPALNRVSELVKVSQRQEKVDREVLS